MEKKTEQAEVKTPSELETPQAPVAEVKKKPDMSAAAKKAWETRRANKAKREAEEKAKKEAEKSAKPVKKQRKTKACIKQET